MDNLSFPQITVSYKDADSSRRTLIRSSKDSYNILRSIYEDCMQHHEECWAMFLNNSGKMLGISCISKSGINAALVDIRIILQTALVSHATSIILSHNHPSGNIRPSAEDNRLTTRLQQAARTMDIALCDHLVVSDGAYYSYADEGKL